MHVQQFMCILFLKVEKFILMTHYSKTKSKHSVVLKLANYGGCWRTYQNQFLTHKKPFYNEVMNKYHFVHFLLVIAWVIPRSLYNN